jgi:hypothetical protein
MAKSADWAMPGAQVFFDLTRMFQHRARVIFHAHAFGDAPRDPFEQCDHRSLKP